MPKEDLEEVPDPCEVTYFNQLVNPNTITCEADIDNHALIMSQVLKDPYLFEELSYIEMSIENIKMPSSIRPTGEYKIEFYAKIEEQGDQYLLVDTVTVTDKIRAVPGGMTQVDVKP